jgi:hypothetical protein
MTSRSILQLSSMSGRDVTERSKAALVEHNS